MDMTTDERTRARFESKTAHRDDGCIVWTNRRRDPVEAVRGAGEDGGLFDLLDADAEVIS